MVLWILAVTLGLVAGSLAARISERLAFLEAKEAAQKKPRVTTVRTLYFCSGCPHNTSTRVPEGSRAAAGIGCHYMAVWMDRKTETFTHMGGEGAQWIGQAPFTEKVAMKGAAMAMASGDRLGLAHTLARLGQKPFEKEGKLENLPGMLAGWTAFRDLNAFPEQSFREWWSKR